MSALSQPAAPDQPQSRLRVSMDAADWAFAALLALGAVIVVAETSGVSFFADDWDLVVMRRGVSAHALLTPHGPHLSLVPIIVYKVLLHVFGGGSYLPFRLLAALDLVIVGLVLGVACRDRWGKWWGLAPVLLLVTLGPGAVTILWSFQDGYALAMTFGFVALIALDRGGRWADGIACAGLIISLGSASQGIGFVVGAAFLVVLTGNWRRRIWVVVVPAILYVAWYAGYGHQHSETELSLWGTSLNYAMTSLSATAGATAGLSSVSPQTGILDTTFGVPIAVTLVVVVAAAAWRGWRPRPIFWAAAATLVVVWFAASLSNYGAFSRPPDDPRYLSSNAMLLMLCVCAAIPRPRLGRSGIAVAGIVLAVVAATNADQYGAQHAAFRAESREQRAELGALELMRGTVSPLYNPGVIDPNLVDNSAGPFFSAADAFGLTEDSASQIEAQPESVRVNVDHILTPNEVSLAPTATAARSATRPLGVLSGSPTRSRGCLIVRDSALDVDASAGRIEISASNSYASTVTVRRFASTYDYGIGTISPGTAATLAIRPDRAPQVPWRLTLTGTGSRVCAIG